MRSLIGVLAALVILVPLSNAYAEEQSCEREAIRRAVQRATGLLSPAEMYNAEVRVDSIEPTGLSVFENHSLIQYLITVRLNNESTVVYSIRTVLNHTTKLCEISKSTTYRRRTEI